MAPRVYATRADLVAYGLPPGVTAPDEPEATRVLTRASERVDDALVSALYRTNTDGTPYDPDVVEALRNATCAQVIEWRRTGDEHGDAGQWQSVGIGSVNLSRNTAAPTAAPGELCDAAERHLRRAGLLAGNIVAL